MQISLLIQNSWFFSLEEAILWIMDSYFSWKQLVSSPDVNWWTGVLWIIVMFLSDSHSDGTHSLQSIHCWNTFLQIWWETNSSTSWMAWGWVNYQQISIFGWTILLVNIICNTVFFCCCCCFSVEAMQNTLKKKRLSGLMQMKCRERYITIFYSVNLYWI